jgi:hypothetical protein
LERAEVRLSGLSGDVEFGSKSEPLTLTLAAELQTQSRLIPESHAIVDNSTWPARTVPSFVIENKAFGYYVPIVIGCPGHTPTEPTPLPAVPVLACEWRGGESTSRIAIHSGVADATNVELWDYTSDPPINDTRPVLQALNKLDATTAVVERGVSVVIRADYYAGFQADSTYGGGERNRDRSGPLRGAGEVLRWLVQTHTDLPVDVGRMASEEQRLNQYKLDGFINKPTRAWDIVRQAIIPLLPVTIRRSSVGYWFQHWRLDASATDAIATLSVERGDIRRISTLRLQNDRIENEFTIRYRRLRQGSNYFSTRILTAETGRPSQVFPTIKADSRTFGSPICARSQELYGVRPARAIETGWIWEDATAAALLRQWALARAVPRLGVSYVGGLELAQLERGAVVLLSDEELHLSEALAIVDDRRDGLSQVEISLTLLQAPGSWPRLTS